MATPAYEDALSRARQLTPSEQLALAEALVAAVRQTMNGQRPHSILELRGLGKDTWNGIDAQAYVDQERNSWNG